MTEKIGLNKKDNTSKSVSEMMPQVEKKIEFFKDVIQKTIIHVQKNKFLDILGISDVCSCIERLGELSKKINEFNDNNSNYDAIVNASCSFTLNPNEYFVVKAWNNGGSATSILNSNNLIQSKATLIQISGI